MMKGRDILKDVAHAVYCLVMQTCKVIEKSTLIRSENHISSCAFEALNLVNLSMKLVYIYFGFKLKHLYAVWNKWLYNIGLCLHYALVVLNVHLTNGCKGICRDPILSMFLV